jgi:uncharacterized protein
LKDDQLVNGAALAWSSVLVIALISSITAEQAVTYTWLSTSRTIMLLHRAALISLLLLGFLAPVTTQEQLEFPQPIGRVSDFANIVGEKAKQHLTGVCVELDQKTHAQIAVVTVDTIGATPIGDYAHLLFNKWGIGHKDDNRGMLILLSEADQTYYIAVGRGFESLFPNERVAGIGAKMIPDLRQRDFDKALIHTVDEVAIIIAKERKVTLKTVTPRSGP